ncbi:hypothetical protein AKO1_012166 [Acrasis kona]|uniref:Pirin-like protein n=1 Tax=Acrasis kona TaxID=1008807 RepID=A0AAW2ZAJ4_9EUKA
MSRKTPTKRKFSITASRVAVLLFILFSSYILFNIKRQQMSTDKQTVQLLSIENVESVTPLPGNEQSDRKNAVIMPGKFEQYDPFLLMFEDWIGRNKGFEDHPHRGIETVTLVLEGQIEHGDNRGNFGVLNVGDVQWMTAGSGLEHREMPHGNGGRTLQLWLNLPPDHKMTTPRYQDIRATSMPTIEEEGVKIRLISGSLEGKTSSTQNIVKTLCLEGFIKKGFSKTIHIPSKYHSFLYLISGRGKFGKEKKSVSHGHVIWTRSNEDGLLFVESEEDLHFFFAGGEPIKAPVVAHGPFVMNSKEQIMQAFSDYRSGKFGGQVRKK